MKKLLCIVAVATLAMASPLFAAGDYSSGTSGTSGTPGMSGTSSASGMSDTNSMTQSTSQIQSPEKLKGMEVVSQTGEKLGKIENVNTDTQTGDIRFVTISKGGVLGIGGNEIAIPKEAFRVDQTQDQVTLTVNEDKLENVPKQSDMSDDEFQRNLEQHYGVAPAWNEGSKTMGTEPSESMDQNQQGMGSESQGMGTTPQSN